MTGAYLSIKREDESENIEIEYLSDEERNELFKNAPNEELLNWLNFMCKQYERLSSEITEFGNKD